MPVDHINSILYPDLITYHETSNAKNLLIDSEPNMVSTRLSGLENKGFSSDENIEILSSNSAETPRSLSPLPSIQSYGTLKSIISISSKETLETLESNKLLPTEESDDTTIMCTRFVVFIVCFVLTLTTAFISKILILLMISMIRPDRTIPICAHNTHFDISPELNPNKTYSVIYQKDDQARIVWIWVLFFAIITPEIMTFLRSVKICWLKGYEKPNTNTYFTLLAIETLNSIGISTMMFYVLPQLSSTKSAMITSCMFLVPSILLILAKFKHSIKNIKKTEYSDLSKNKGNGENTKKFIIGTVIGIYALSIWIILVSVEIYNTNQMTISHYISFVISLILSLLCISLQWWENFIEPNSCPNCLNWLLVCKYDLEKGKQDGSRYLSYIFISCWKITVTFLTMGIWEMITDKTPFTFLDHLLTPFHYSNLNVIEDKTLDIHVMRVSDPYIPLWVLITQITASYICYETAKFSMKIRLHQLSLGIPLYIVMALNVLSLFLLDLSNSSPDMCKITDYYQVFQYVFWLLDESFKTDKLYIYVPFICWLICIGYQYWFSLYIFEMKNERMAMTETLFVIPMYSSAVIDQSLVMNIRRHKINMEKNKNDRLTIRVCATMYHETKSEMETFVNTILKLHEEHQHWEEITPKNDSYDIKYDIFFDKAFEKKKVNKYVEDLIITIEVLLEKFHEFETDCIQRFKTDTPYGQRLTWVFSDGKTSLNVHLKDTNLIRHRKRWSQCMYMHWILDEFNNVDLENIKDSKDKVENTYILALDGDIKFYHDALDKLVDLIKKNSNVGAACGRVHPVGSGPMVWYQKFEYALGHWFQKATEHVFGCVLCSPGCFSLFRGSALMKVMETYSTTATEPLHHIKYDQGEDRWLCTLLLKQGFRIEYCAASDSYTHAPETFSEFYVQRRRWAPSTMANIIEIMSESKSIIRKNSDLTWPYIIYQAILLFGAIISPGIIFLMIVSSIDTVMGIPIWAGLLVNILVILFFFIMCLVHYKNDKYIIFVAMILSSAYALLMLAVIVGVIVDTFVVGIYSFNSMFFYIMISCFVIAAITHPQEWLCVLPLPLYLVLIPSMYCLLPIYALTNMNNVNWGTREGDEKDEETQETKGNGFWALIRKTSLMTCLFCSQPTEDSDALEKVTEELKGLGAKLKNIESRVKELCLEKQVHNSDEPTQEVSQDSKPTDPKTDTEREQIDSMSIQVESPRDKLIEEILNEFEVKDLGEENEFWKYLINKYLKPIVLDKEEKSKMASKLAELRNRAVFYFGMINAMVVFLICIFQSNQHIIYQEFGGVKMDPTKISMLVVFGTIFGLQLIGMFCHRMETLCHLLSSTSLKVLDCLNVCTCFVDLDYDDKNANVKDQQRQTEFNQDQTQNPFYIKYTKY